MKGMDNYGPTGMPPKVLKRGSIIYLYVGPTTIRGMGSRGDRVGGLMVKGPFKVTALPTESDPPQAKRFSPASLSDHSPN